MLSWPFSVNGVNNDDVVCPICVCVSYFKEKRERKSEWINARRGRKNEQTLKFNVTEINFLHSHFERSGADFIKVTEIEIDLNMINADKWLINYQTCLLLTIIENKTENCA